MSLMTREQAATRFALQTIASFDAYMGFVSAEQE